MRSARQSHGALRAIEQAESEFVHRARRARVAAVQHLENALLAFAPAETHHQILVIRDAATVAFEDFQQIDFRSHRFRPCTPSSQSECRTNWPPSRTANSARGRAAACRRGKTKAWSNRTAFARCRSNSPRSPASADWWPLPRRRYPVRKAG